VVLWLSSLETRWQQPERGINTWRRRLLPPVFYATACFSARLVVAYSSSGVNGFAM
jgi:hypothetical protein